VPRADVALRAVARERETRRCLRDDGVGQAPAIEELTILMISLNSSFRVVDPE
jgi:hypothetical protein